MKLKLRSRKKQERKEHPMSRWPCVPLPRTMKMKRELYSMSWSAGGALLVHMNEVTRNVFPQASTAFVTRLKHHCINLISVICFLIIVPKAVHRSHFVVLNCIITVSYILPHYVPLCVKYDQLRSIPFRYLCNYTGRSWNSNVTLNRTDNDTLADRWSPCGAETELKAEVARGNKKEFSSIFFLNWAVIFWFREAAMLQV